MPGDGRVTPTPLKDNPLYKEALGIRDKIGLSVAGIFESIGLGKEQIRRIYVPNIIPSVVLERRADQGEYNLDLYTNALIVNCRPGSFDPNNSIILRAGRNTPRVVYGFGEQRGILKFQLVRIDIEDNGNEVVNNVFLNEDFEFGYQTSKEEGADNCYPVIVIGPNQTYVRAAAKLPPNWRRKLESAGMVNGRQIVLETQNGSLQSPNLIGYSEKDEEIAELIRGNPRRVDSLIRSEIGKANLVADNPTQGFQMRRAVFKVGNGQVVDALVSMKSRDYSFRFYIGGLDVQEVKRCLMDDGFDISKLINTLKGNETPYKETLIIDAYMQYGKWEMAAVVRNSKLAIGTDVVFTPDPENPRANEQILAYLIRRIRAN